MPGGRRSAAAGSGGLRGGGCGWRGWSVTCGHSLPAVGRARRPACRGSGLRSSTARGGRRAGWAWRWRLGWNRRGPVVELGGPPRGAARRGAVTWRCVMAAETRPRRPRPDAFGDARAAGGAAVRAGGAAGRPAAAGGAGAAAGGGQPGRVDGPAGRGCLGRGPPRGVGQHPADVRVSPAPRAGAGPAAGRRRSGAGDQRPRLCAAGRPGAAGRGGV